MMGLIGIKLSAVPVVILIASVGVEWNSLFMSALVWEIGCLLYQALLVLQVGNLFIFSTFKEDI